LLLLPFNSLFYLGVFGNLLLRKSKNNTKNLDISYCLCQNEENLANFIPLLAEQDYPDFEIILIDDASSDDTLEVLEGFEKQYSNIRLVKSKITSLLGNKKYAMTLGIKSAKKGVSIVYGCRLLPYF
jgi:cellulose synthase/poly-beta-1,6-N-acetylglucosamine synthase-like glycosyltransferase